MKFLVLSDLHGADKNLDLLDSEFKNADAVIFAGDFSECFKPKTGKVSMKKLCEKHDTIFAVLGNCDPESYIEDMEENDISIERSIVFHEGIALCGSGGGEIFTKKTEFERTREELQSDFDIVDTSVEQSGNTDLWKSMILVSHNPPLGEIVDKVNEQVHPGSPVFTDYINKNQPIAVICGHVHEGRGVEKFGQTYVINPGALVDGFYAWLEVTKDKDGNWKASEPELKKL